MQICYKVTLISNGRKALTTNEVFLAVQEQCFLWKKIAPWQELYNFTNLLQTQKDATS